MSMNREKSAIIVKNYAITEGWLVLSPLLLILGYILKERIKSEREYKGIMITLSVIYGFTAFVFISAIIFVILESINQQVLISNIFTITLSILLSYFLIGRPLRHCIENLFNKNHI